MKFGDKFLDLSRPHVMGILNITPDSFYDGGRFLGESGLVKHDVCLSNAEEMIKRGASILDVGGESTRPGAAKVSLQEELDRVVPVVEALCINFDCVVSVDTSRPEVMTAAASFGAGLINDVRALQLEGAMEAAANTGLPVCLMHMQGQPENMQIHPQYEDVVNEVTNFLKTRVSICCESGIDRDKILLDPGFGFGKSDKHNLLLLKYLSKMRDLGHPILVGLSRKSMIGRLLARELPERLPASLALGLIALQNGASILRVHDVQETMDVVDLLRIIQEI